MKVILNAGVYDLCHEGHLTLLKKMRKMADILVIGLVTDETCYHNKGKIPIQDFEKRAKNLGITGLVDRIEMLYTSEHEEEYEKILKEYKLDEIVYVRGDDANKFPGKNFLKRNKIPIVYLPYTQGVSSTIIKEKLTKTGKK